MPLARDTTLPLSATFTFSDNNGKQANCSFNLPNDLTVAEAETYIQGLEIAMANISDARIERATVTLVFTQPAAYTYVAPASSEVERKMAVRFLDSTGFYDFKVEVPSPLHSLEVNNTDEYDVTNAAIAAFVTAVIDGPLGPGNGALTFGGRDLVRVDRAYNIHRYRQARR